MNLTQESLCFPASSFPTEVILIKVAHLGEAAWVGWKLHEAWVHPKHEGMGWSESTASHMVP